MRLILPVLMLLCGGCSDGLDRSERPAWADGRMVREPRPNGQRPQSLANFEARLLAVHNRERAAKGAPPLVWDRALAAAASAYGPALIARGSLAHSEQASRPGQGENLWMGTRGAYSLEEIAGSWADERSLFRAGTFPNVSASGKWSDVGHYTQMIWRGTTSVGCSLRRSARWDYLICRYSPPGNVLGRGVP
ncbi:MAG: CAP domain-containing protein [Allosphingosinicella sp.]